MIFVLCAPKGRIFLISSSFIPRENVHPGVTNIDLPEGENLPPPLLLLSTGSENSVTAYALGHDEGKEHN